MSEIEISSLLQFGIIAFMLMSIVGVISKKLKILPQVTWVLLLGLLYGALEKGTMLPLPHVELTHDLVLMVFVPLLVFGSAQMMCLKRLREVLWPASLLASLGILISMVVVASVLVFAIHLPWTVALLYGAVMSATDPLAVGALLQGNKSIPEKTHLLIEGESILNDGFVVTIFGLLTVILFGGGEFSVVEGAGELIFHILGAIALGVIVGYVGRYSLVLLHENTSFVRMNMTITMAYGSYFLAETLGVSGILAVFCTALVYGYALDRKDHVQDITTHIWEYLDHVANVALFFLLGATYFSVITPEVISLGLSALVIVLAYVGRYIALRSLWGIVRKSGFGSRDMTLMNLAGARGAVSIALILLLPESFPYRDFFLSCGFIVILWTLVAYPIVTQIMLGRDEGKNEERVVG